MSFLLVKMECEVNLRKAKQAFMVRCEEYDKAKTAACRAEEEGGGSTAKSIEKKKRLEEEARYKVLVKMSHLHRWFQTLCDMWSQHSMKEVN